MRLIKAWVFLALSAPLVWLGVLVAAEIDQPGSALGADPGEAVVAFLGQWTLRMVLLTLCVSSLRRRLGWTWMARLRRMIGLFAYTYLCLHLSAYVGFLAGFDWRSVVEDFTERAYITAGMAAFVLLTPLALTSTRGWQRRLGRRWRQLHWLIYPAAVLGIVHLVWLTKDGYGEVIVYALWLALLFGERWVSARRGAR